jgi:hypothetical protein
VIDRIATAHWTGPDRRQSTEEERAEWQRQWRLKRTLLLEACKKVGIASSGLVLIMAAFWVGRVESHIAAEDEAMRSLAVTVKSVADLADSVKSLQYESRQDAEARTKILVQLERLNGQIEVLREDANRRANQ